MKKFAVITLSLLTAVVGFGSISANASAGGTIYPEDSEFIKTLSLSSLTDYAVEDGLYAFAEDKTVKVYNDGEYSEYRFASEVRAVDISDGTIYCGCTDGNAYTLADQTECEYAFPERQDEITYSGFYYFVDGDGMNVFDKSSKTTETYEGEYTNLKLYGESVYAMDENALYTFTGTHMEEVVLEYADYSATRQITIGQASSALKTYAPVQFVEIEKGAFMTEVDLEQLDGEFFVPVKTVKAEENTVALLLCYSGNASIISIGDTCYVLLKSKTAETQIECTAENSYKNAQMIGGMIYASPYIVSGTISSSNAIGATVKVISRLECESILETVFYEVEYSQDDKTVKGYVAEGFLSPVTINDDIEPVEIQDPQYSESNDTKTILIILAVILLILAAIAYISHVSSKGKKSKKKSKEKNDEA